MISKYAWVVPLKDRNGGTVRNPFRKIIAEHRTTQYSWVDQDSEFCNKFMKEFLGKHDIKIYSTFGGHKTLSLKDLTKL